MRLSTYELGPCLFVQPCSIVGTAATTVFVLPHLLSYHAQAPQLESSAAMDGQSPSRDFLSHVEDHQEEGLTCELLPEKFVCYSTLKVHWSLDRIRAVSRHASITTPASQIRAHYLIVFSILVAVSHTESHALGYFDTLVSERRNDSTLPWTEPPRALRGNFDSHAPAVYKTFEATQWPFCPVLFEMKNPLSNARLDRRRVFPFTDTKAMGDSRVNAEARVCSVGIHRRAHEHLPNASQV